MKNKITPQELEARWQANVSRAKEIVSIKSHNQMEVARLALEVCEISWGGSQHRDKYTLSKFAEEIGIAGKTLSNWVAVRKKVYDKLPIAIAQKAGFVSLWGVARRVSPHADSEFVLKKYQELNSSKEDMKMRRYLGYLRSIAHNFQKQNAAMRLDNETMEEYLFYTKIIIRCIKNDRPGLKAKDNGISGKDALTNLSAAQALSVSRNHSSRVFMKTEVGDVALTPKDRDIINFIRKTPGKFYSPTELGMKLKGHNRSSASAWAFRTLNKLNGTGLIERNKYGKYAWVK
jgi:hypothetical protein